MAAALGLIQDKEPHNGCGLCCLFHVCRPSVLVRLDIITPCLWLCLVVSAEVLYPQGSPSWYRRQFALCLLTY